MKKKYVSQFTFTKFHFKTLVGFGSHLGATFTDWRTDTSFLVKVRISKFPFVDLSFTSVNLSFGLRFLRFCVSRFLRVLFFLKQGFQWYILKGAPAWFWRTHGYIVSKWLPGILSNYHVTRSAKPNRQRLMNQFMFPGVLIFLGASQWLHTVSAEARSSRTPSIGLSDLDSGPSPFNYSIYSNNRSFFTSMAFYKVFFYGVIEGSYTASKRYIFRGLSNKLYSLLSSSYPNLLHKKPHYINRVGFNFQDRHTRYFMRRSSRRLNIFTRINRYTHQSIRRPALALRDRFFFNPVVTNTPSFLTAMTVLEPNLYYIPICDMPYPIVEEKVFERRFNVWFPKRDVFRKHYKAWRYDYAVSLNERRPYRKKFRSFFFRLRMFCGKWGENKPEDWKNRFSPTFNKK